MGVAPPRPAIRESLGAGGWGTSVWVPERDLRQAGPHLGPVVARGPRPMGFACRTSSGVEERMTETIARGALLRRAAIGGAAAIAGGAATAALPRRAGSAPSAAQDARVLELRSPAGRYLQQALYEAAERPRRPRARLSRYLEVVLRPRGGARRRPPGRARRPGRRGPDLRLRQRRCRTRTGSSRTAIRHRGPHRLGPTTARSANLTQEGPRADRRRAGLGGGASRRLDPGGRRQASRAGRRSTPGRLTAEPGAGLGLTPQRGGAAS